jgi:hypothetical protein
MAETVGSLIDKISIIELRLWHMREVQNNPLASTEARAKVERRLDTLIEQRRDLCDELSELWRQLQSGEAAPKIYRQFKMYNDAGLREASTPREKVRIRSTTGRFRKRSAS